jgi:hypothetical protein
VQDMRTASKPQELAVSWRDSEFDLVGYTYTRMHDGSSSTRGDDTPFPARFALAVQLRSTRSPLDVLTVYDTHSNQKVERYERAPGHPYDNVNAHDARIHLHTLGTTLATRAGDVARSRWAVLLADLNWDYVADQRTLRPGFVEGQVGEWAVSSFESMGVADRPYTHPLTKRRIDYVFLTDDTPAHFRTQSVRVGYHSDHRPVVAGIGLD